MLFRSIYILFITFLTYPVYGQKKYTIHFINNDVKQFVKNPKSEFKDSLEAINYLRDIRMDAISNGFLLASIDNITFGKNNANVAFFLGETFEHAIISIDPTELLFIRKKTALSEKAISSLPMNPKALAITMNRILTAYLNNGYPFVEIKLENIELSDSQITANLLVKKGRFNNWNEIHIKGDSSLYSNHIANLINIHVGDSYSEYHLKKISERIRRITYIEELKPSEILFTNEGVELYLYLKSVPVSTVNGVIGFQPNPETAKLNVTGELNLKLLNSLQRGELLNIKWQSIRDQTQSLKSRINYPYLFNSTFGLDGQFKLYKRDSTFLELDVLSGIQYSLNRGNIIKTYYRNISSSVLSGNVNNPLFSNIGNVSSNNYGMYFLSNQVDYLPNPTKGRNIEFEGSVGSRKSQSTDTSQISKSITYRSSVSIEFFIPLAKRHVLRLSNHTDTYFADKIFQNEVFRFGGLNSQRGFNEDELFASSLNTSTVEYRFSLDKNSYAFLFFDQSWYENTALNYFSDTPFGFGSGFSFSTNLGVFSISYALGKQFDNPILLSNSKVHFGYIALF